MQVWPFPNIHVYFEVAVKLNSWQVHGARSKAVLNLVQQYRLPVQIKMKPVNCTSPNGGAANKFKFYFCIFLALKLYNYN
jgi:hypothetical protein